LCPYLNLILILFFPLPKNHDSVEGPSRGEQTPGMSWLTVVMGGMLLAGNVLELGGVPLAAREWTAWMLAGIILVHGVGLGWPRVGQGDNLRLPRWPILAATLILCLVLAWCMDQTSPWVSRDTLFLATEAWLLCWVVAVTPGTRALSWAWLIVLAAATALALMAAIGWQATGDGLWLPAGRHLPEEWLGRWSGTLPLPGAFGAMMLLTGPTLLVMASARQLPVLWRMLCGCGGFAMLLGAVFSFSLGASVGVAFALAILPWVVTQSKALRFAGWMIAVVLLGGWIYFLSHLRGLPETWYRPLLAAEPTLDTTWSALGKTWQSDLLFGGRGASFRAIAFSAGVPGSEGGWSYGFSDWSELAVRWGLLGIGLVAVIFGGLLKAGWTGWARLPRWASVEMTDGRQQVYTPETKVLLGATVSGLSVFVVGMLASRSLNVPAVVFALAIMAGVLARNVPQRGGSWRLEPAVRTACCLGLAVVIAVLLVWKMAWAVGAQQKCVEAQSLILQTDRTPDAELLLRARADLHEALVDDPNYIPIILNLAWLELAQARLDPKQTEFHSSQAEYQALRASNLAPRAPEPWVVRALACWLANRPKDAMANINKALELEPSDPEVLYYATWLRKVAAKSSTTPVESLVLPPRFVLPDAWPPLEGLLTGAEYRHAQS